MASSWFEELEARLEQQLEAFLQANPEQDALLAEQEARDRQLELQTRRRSLQGQAEQRRQELLRLAGEIRQWQERITRARAAGATELADQAVARCEALMEQGRRAWQELANLGQSFAATEAALEELAARARQGRPTQQPRQQSTGRPAAEAPAEPAQTARPPASDNLEAAWAAFETRQELEALKRRQGHTP
ncbi:hercynine metabolism protein [Synechococcus sp. CS-1328]|uniref:hercynine metabolism protein n=1 Tax=Synechococcus sp. CS-1328 TaxID=2847976 RepID=UPI0021E1C9C7|nr:hercynine metabolism protein [Synechococcus sp. CS-1328]MCT0225020.1 hypothetical protein [Synechococcus sp. CS-1328]